MEETIRILPKSQVTVVKKSTNKKKTHEQYMAELAIVNPNLEAVDKYDGVNKRIMHHCLIHDVYWKTTPASALQGCGCKLCHSERIGKKRKKTHEEYVDELSLKNPDIEVCERYIDADTIIKHHCKIHDIFWNVRPQNVLNGQGCIMCGREKTTNARRKTHEQYVNEAKEVNPNIMVTGKYVNTNTPIGHKCLIDGYEWDAIPSGILGGSGCPKCAGNIKKTHEEYIFELEEKNPYVESLERYININTPILHRCIIHDIQWNVAPINVLLGRGCVKCWRERNGKSLRKTHEQYVEELEKVNSGIIAIDEYIDIKTPIKHQCLAYMHEWYTTPKSTLQGNGCPKCNQSRGERKISEWLENHNIQYIHQHSFEDCRDKKQLPFDFYLPDFNYCIEYDGRQHFEPVDFAGKGKEWAQRQFELVQYHDSLKNNYCQDNNIRLLRIPYYEDIEETLNNFLFI